MLSIGEKAAISQLLRAGIGVTEIAQRTGRSIGTIYNVKKVYLDKSLIPEDMEHSVKITEVKDFIDQQIRLGANNNKKLYAAALEQGYRGSYALINKYAQQRVIHSKPYRRSQRVETTPGEQAQVDWGSFGKITIGDRIEPLYAFVYVLSYSRALYIEFVIRQNQQTLHSCHEHAFAKLGIPRNIRYDNMKTIVLSRERLADGTSKDRLTPAFKDFARYYSFNIELCPRYWPRSKGKVESAVKYARHNFMDLQIFGKTFKNLAELNEQAWRWVDNIAQQRIHRSTGEKPYESWWNEKRFLQFPNLPAYSSNPFLERRSTKDGLVQYKKNLYAVPMPFAQKKLSIREAAEHGVAYLEIYYKKSLITKHRVSLEQGKWVLDGEDSIAENSKGQLVNTLKRKHQPKRPEVMVIPRGLSHYNNFIPNREK